MEAFQGVSYHCLFEEEPRKTTAAIVLACLGFQPSEFIFVVAADHLIGSEGYKESLLEAKDRAKIGNIVLFGKNADTINKRFGYIFDGKLYEKPDEIEAKGIGKKDFFQNLGMMLFQNGLFLNEMRNIQEDIFYQCRSVFKKRTTIPEGTIYKKEALDMIIPIAIEKSLLEKTDKLYCVKAAFSWEDIGSLEDLEKTKYKADGVGIISESINTTILNQSPRHAVVVNGVDNVLVINMPDAIYIGQKGISNRLKGILHDYEELKSFSNTGAIIYREWGYREKIDEDNNYRVQKVTILPGKTIYEHKHEERIENWTIIKGSALITLDGDARTYGENECITAQAGVSHQLSNNGEQNLVLIETAVGEVLNQDMILQKDVDVSEADLGFHIESIVKLSPIFKDYIWGGTKLRDIYGKKCDYDTIAESWELSAHPAGNSIIASGRHKGLNFSRYLEIVGKDVLGWKCMSQQSFPLLIKFIDAKQNLSVQVHPNDDYALENENEYGKNEMWYIVDSEEGAGVYVGFNKNIDKNEVKKRIGNNTILDVLNFFPTKPGEVFLIPSGTIHAIGAGNLVCEIQQSSNSTYRIYDYNRTDKFGNPRELHLKKALDVLNYKKYEPTELEKDDGKLRCKYFEIGLVVVVGHEKIHLSNDSFYSVTCIKGKGNGKIAMDEVIDISSGDTFFIPATNNLLFFEGNMTLLITKV